MKLIRPRFYLLTKKQNLKSELEIFSTLGPRVEKRSKVEGSNLKSQGIFRALPEVNCFFAQIWIIFDWFYKFFKVNQVIIVNVDFFEHFLFLCDCQWHIQFNCGSSRRNKFFFWTKLKGTGDTLNNNLNWFSEINPLLFSSDLQNAFLNFQYFSPI